jgi:hypothetical protein
MDIDRASRSLRATFERDTREATRDLAGKKKTSLEELQKQLAAAAKETKSRPPEEPHVVEDEKRAVSRVAGQRRLDVRDLIDTATLVDFLRNWDELLRSVPVGSRVADSFQPLGSPTQAPGTPAPAAKGGDPFGLGGGPGGAGATSGQPAVKGPVPILFDPKVSREKLLQSGGDVEIDDERLEVIGKVYTDCVANQREFRDCADALVREDANLAALDQAPDPKLLRSVSGLRGSSDAEATSVMTRVTGENIKHLDDLLTIVPNIDWKALRVTHGLLLGGSYKGASGVAWSGLVERTFIDGYFKRTAEAERAEAERKMYAQLALGAVTFLALLSPAAPLAAAVLAAADVYGAATAVGAVADAKKAEKKADDLGTAATAGFGDTEEAKRARKEADDRKAGIAMDLLLAALPFIPGAVKGAGVAKGFKAEGRFAALADEAKSMARALHKDTRGAIRIDVLLTGGVSALTGAVRNPATKAQVLDHMCSMIHANPRTTRHVWVEPALPTRPGAEELRPWLATLLDPNRPQILARLHADRLRVEPILKAANYEIGVNATVKNTRVNEVFNASVTMGPPPNGQVTRVPPIRER